jgi:MSHA biogenesis protein MshG
MLQEDVDRLTGQVRTGGRLAECLPQCKYITPFAKRMITAGETAADLPRMCAVVARHYERESAHLIKNISTVIEPILVVAIAGVVMVVALAIFLPMWDMVKLMG